jgi:hypothetical protein
MATTTNFEWETPDDTDLVKDGAAAIRTLGSSIDTSLVDLLGGTTGQLLSKTSNTDMDFTFINPGDIGGGMTLLSTTTLSGATTTISSINQGYNELIVYVTGATNATGNGFLRCDLNGVTNTLVRVDTFYVSNAESAGTSGSTDSRIFFGAGQVWDRTSANNAVTLRLPNYSSTTSMKPTHAFGGYYGSGPGYNGFNVAGFFFDTTAISSLVFSNSGGNHSTGTVRIYGVK